MAFDVGFFAEQIGLTDPVRPLLSNAQVFEFVTDKGTRLPLDGTLKNWSDDHGQDIATHKILKRSGAIHQVPGNPPPLFNFDCVLLGFQITRRYRLITDALDASPMGQLTHPRLGSFRAVCKGLKAKEDPGSEIDVIMFTIVFERSGLRQVQALSAPGEAAAAAWTVANALDKVTFRLPRVLKTVTTLQSYVGVFGEQVAALSSGAAVVPIVSAALAQVQAQAQTVAQEIGQDPVNYDLVSLVRLSAGQCLASYNVAVANRPPVVTRTVPGVMGLGRFCQLLYRGRARELQPEVEILNRIARPHALPDRSVLLVPDPVVVLAARR